MQQFVESTPVEEKKIIKIPAKDPASAKDFIEMSITIVYEKSGDRAGTPKGIKFSAKTVLTCDELRFIQDNYSQILGYGFNDPVSEGAKK